MILGERLREAREAKGWSQVYVSKILGITSQTLSNYERSERDPDTSTLNKLAELYGVTTDYFFGRNNQYPDVNVSYELHEGANIRSMTDVDHVLNEVRKELSQYINEGRISEEKAVHAVDLLRQQLMLLLEQK